MTSPLQPGDLVRYEQPNAGHPWFTARLITPESDDSGPFWFATVIELGTYFRADDGVESGDEIDLLGHNLTVVTARSWHAGRNAPRTESGRLSVIESPAMHSHSQT